ncbi:hypothetical protein N7481_010044 [Penicillium waksmanii]|uniref:uncharacterized protein n=1 Tax=Penicillium waksmanii TaxID=69791 RepID=UPI002546FA3F|nr:uncharacterized protein N7481_010044 [Penicillium waksmanii]KAJ5976337.1 hypothetical protein N7481_010044 [Penicillium waksmanii]
MSFLWYCPKAVDRIRNAEKRERFQSPQISSPTSTIISPFIGCSHRCKWTADAVVSGVPSSGAIGDRVPGIDVVAPYCPVSPPWLAHDDVGDVGGQCLECREADLNSGSWVFFWKSSVQANSVVANRETP